MNYEEDPIKNEGARVTTLAPSFLIGSSSFLQATRKPIIYQMGFEIQSDLTRDL